MKMTQLIRYWVLLCEWLNEMGSESPVIAVMTAHKFPLLPVVTDYRMSVIHSIHLTMSRIVDSVSASARDCFIHDYLPNKLYMWCSLHQVAPSGVCPTRIRDTTRKTGKIASFPSAKNV